jgi:hypothetical protein
MTVHTTWSSPSPPPWLVDGRTGCAHKRLHMGELDVPANRPRLLSLLKKQTHSVPDELGKQLEESCFRVIARDQSAGFLKQRLHSSYHNGLEQSFLGRKMPIERFARWVADRISDFQNRATASSQKQQGVNR